MPARPGFRCPDCDWAAAEPPPTARCPRCEAELPGLAAAPTWRPAAADSRTVAPHLADTPRTVVDPIHGAGAAAPDVVEPGGRLGAYELECELARGGMGIVYRARHPGLDRVVALKVVLDSGRRDPQEAQRFLLECRVVSQLSHPHIVTLYDMGVVEGRPYYTMEYIDGCTLHDRLADPSFERPARLAMLACVARAVHHAHLRGIIHRDLKPSNVLVTRAGEPKVADFGLAKLTEDDGAALTRTGGILGTPQYMSPEQASGRTQDLDLRSDIFSLGVILYEALCGRLPFGGGSPLEILHEVAQGEIRPLERSLPRDLVQITQRALAADPDARYQTAAALADDLEAFADGRPVSACPQPLATRVRRWVRRHPTLSATAAAVGLVLLGTYVWLARRPAELVIATGDDTAARVELDGVPVGEVQPQRPLRLDRPPGSTTLRVVRDGHFPYESTMTLAPGGRRELTVRLRRRAGILSVLTDPPDARVTVVGRDAALIPSTPGFAELAGDTTHRIRIEKPGYRTLEEVVTPRSGGHVTRARFTLVRLGSARLALSTDQPGLHVRLQPVTGDLGPTLGAVPADGPLKLTLQAGRYQVSAGWPGYVDRQLELDLAADTERTLRINLTPIQIRRQRLGAELGTSPLLGDVNRDGRLDLIVAPKGAGPRCLSFDRRTGRWVERWRLSQLTIGPTTDGLLVDVDADGGLDLITALHTGQGEMMYAISGVDGSVLWRTDVGQAVDHPLAADLDGNGTLELVQASRTGHVHVLDARSGRRLRTDRPTRGRVLFAALSEATGDDRLELILATEDEILIHDLRTGRTPRRRAVPSGSNVRPIAAELDREPGPELVVCLGRHVVIEDAVSGAARWRRELATQVQAVFVMPHPDGPSLVVLERLGRMNLLDGATGAPRWPAVELGQHVSGYLHPAIGDVDGDGTLDIVISGAGGRIMAVEGRSGRVLVRLDLATPIPSSPTIADSDGDGQPELHLLSQSGALLTVDIRWSRQHWLRTTGRIRQLWPLAARGRVPARVFVAPNKASLRVVRLSDGQDIGASGRLYARSLSGPGPDVDGDGCAELFAAGASKLVCLDGATGAWRWAQTHEPEGIPRLARPVDLDGDAAPDALVAFHDDREDQIVIVARAGRTGALLWRRRLADPGSDGGLLPWLRPLIADVDGDGQPEVLVAAPTKRLWLLEGRDGRVRWQRRFELPRVPSLRCPPTVIDLPGEGPMVVQTVGSTLFRLAPSSGQDRAPPIDRGAYLITPITPLRAGRKTRRLLIYERSLWCHDDRLERVAWSHQVGQQLAWTAPSLADTDGDAHDETLFATNAGTLVLLDGQTGAERWRYRTGTTVLGCSPQLVQQGSRWLALIATGRHQLNMVRVPTPDAQPAYWPRPLPLGTSGGLVARATGPLRREQRLNRLLRLALASPPPSPRVLDDALRCYRAAIGDDPWSRTIAGLAALRARSADALRHLDAALALAPRLGLALELRARARLGAGQVEAALGDLDALLVPGSTTAAAYALRGRIRMRRNELTRAVLDFSESLAREPDRHSNRIMRASALVAMGRLDAAWRDLHHLLEADRVLTASLRGSACLTRGQLFEKRGNRARALADFREAVQYLKLGAASAQLHLAEAGVARLAGGK